jgi:hypothetical protein
MFGAHTTHTYNYIKLYNFLKIIIINISVSMFHRFWQSFTILEEGKGNKPMVVSRWGLSILPNRVVASLEENTILTAKMSYEG